MLGDGVGRIGGNVDDVELFKAVFKVDVVISRAAQGDDFYPQIAKYSGSVVKTKI